MPEYIVGTKTVLLRPADVIGQGGEADIYRRGGEAYKIFKQPSHPDFEGDLALQENARQKIAEHQHKLPALKKLRLPPRAAMPGELLRDKRGLIAGYQMNFVEDADVLLHYSELDFRERGVSDELVIKTFIDLHKTTSSMHPAGAVISDYNDLNVLAKHGIPEAHLIDIDSISFGKYQSRMFTAHFVDPLICDPHGKEMSMIRPHSPESDWYAYLVMLMRSLLFIGPYGGVYRPKDPKKRVSHDARPLKRITIFDPEVKCPVKARRHQILPDALLHHLEQVFVKDKRGIPPLALIEDLRFTTCTKCGISHARAVCPDCVGITAPMLKEVHMGKVKGFRAFETPGIILYATMQKKLRYLYHHDGAYKRDGEKTVVKAPLEPNIRYRIKGDDTIIARGSECLLFSGAPAPEIARVDALGQLPLIDANEEHLFVSQGGVLNQIGPLGIYHPERIGDVTENQTLFWVGEKLGFGFYRAAELVNYFIFRADRRGLNDSVKLPNLRGQLVDSTCSLSSTHAWFFTSTMERGRAVNRCFLIYDRGDVLGSAEASVGDGSWLGHIRGACAVRDFLLVPTDDGVARIALQGTALGVVKEFPDAARFVDASTGLFAGPDGLYVVRKHDIWRIVMQ